MKNSYLQELSLALKREGLAIGAETEDGSLPVEPEGKPLCLVTPTGAVKHQREDVADDAGAQVLDRVTELAHTVAVYMRQMGAAPFLTASGLGGSYRLLAEFNDIVLAGRPTEYGVQFITWARDADGDGVHWGHYHGFGADSYTAAKQDFAVRSGLVPHSALFAQKEEPSQEQGGIQLC